jgi:hypothetical protein
MRIFKNLEFGFKIILLYIFWSIWLVSNPGLVELEPTQD